MNIIILSYFLILCVILVNGASKKKPHGHKGVLDAYNGKPIPSKVTSDQNKKLDKGDAVSIIYILSYYIILFNK